MKYLGILMLSSLVGCASIHSGNIAKTESADPSAKQSARGVTISGIEMTELSSDYFAAIDLTFENTTNKWISVTDVYVTFPEPKLNESIEFPIGKQLQEWAKASQRMKAINSHNAQMFMSALAVAGGVVAATGNNTGDTNTGLSLIAAGATGLSVKSVQDNYRSLQQSKQVPEDHLLGGNFSIPPGLHSKKWFTIFAASPFDIPFVEEVILNYKIDGVAQTSKLEIRKTFNSSDFQEGYSGVQATRLAEQDRKRREEESKKTW